MCCFSRPIEAVYDTKIFARGLAGVSQQLVYSMGLRTPYDVAMILPIPVKRGSGEKAVRFISLNKYPDFFEDLQKGFPLPRGQRLLVESAGTATDSKQLDVVKVGNFEASFVPTVKDFSRLDERFRLPMETWQKLPRYQNYGFVVFKFKKGSQHVHPMAFEFPREHPKRIFFPTVHIHDGTIEEEAGFDHALFCQLPEDDVLMLRGWRESYRPAGMFMNKKKSRGLIDPTAHCHRSSLTGKRPNADLWL
jgi:hypothetical protein